MRFSNLLFYLYTATESLGKVQGFGMHMCRAMWYTGRSERRGWVPLRSHATNNVRCGNLIYCCYSVYELLELLSESMPSEDREETVASGKRVSQPPVIGRWLMLSRARIAWQVLLTRKHIVSQICRAASWGAYLSDSTA